MATWAPRLSKSRFQAGLQCPKYLWLLCHAPELADPVTESQQAVFDQGHAVGALARRLFPGGVLVEEDHTQTAQALETTRSLLGEGASCVYEGAFRHDGVLIRADALFREDGCNWTLVEVKSSTEVKPEYITDLGIQTYVLRGAGIPVASSRVLHLDNSYVYPGGPYDLGRLFTVVDVTPEVEAFLPSIPGLLSQMRQMLAGPVPDTQIGRRCDRPYACPFYGSCHGWLPEFPVTEIPRVSNELLCSLLAEGYCSIREVPLSYPGLSPYQRTVCGVIQTGEPRFDSKLARALSELREPIRFLDFETFRSALPIHAGTRPYQALPVQWSCHTLHSEGLLEHTQFLHTGRSDPRRDFALSLLAALDADGAADSPIVVYTSYENTILTSLAQDLPEFSAPIAAVQARLFDLHELVRDYVQHPDFHGRTSLKYVLPALVDDLSYEGLAVQDGEVASLRWAEAVHSDIAESLREAIFDDLRAYCATDTLALVKLYQALLRVG